jgi:uncharacterized RDD family membrane protein YckC
MERTPYAGLVTRTLALALDALVINLSLTVVTTVVGLAISVFTSGDDNVDTATVLAVLGGWWVIGGIYFVFFWTLTGHMRVLHLRVVSADGGRVRLGQSLRRIIGAVLAAIPLMAGYLMVLVDERRRGLHDRIAGTVVLYVPEEEEASALPLRAAALAPAPGTEERPAPGGPIVRPADGELGTRS